MTLDTMSRVWEYSPYEGQKLLLHLALAEIAVPSFGGLGGHIELEELAPRARFRRIDALIEQLENMENDEHLSELHFEHIGERWASVSYLMDLDFLLPSYQQKRHYELVEKYNLLLDSSKNSHPIQGYVYLLKVGENYKIGRTINLDRRIEQLAIQLPYKPELISSIETENPVALEKHVHGLFKRERLNGEWFKLDDEQVEMFTRIRRYDVQTETIPPLALGE